jgi:hypothetical protein
MTDRGAQKQIPRGNDRKKGKGNVSCSSGDKGAIGAKEKSDGRGLGSSLSEVGSRNAVLVGWTVRRPRGSLGYWGLEVFAGLGSDGVGGFSGFDVGLGVVAGDALHAFFEAAEAFPEALAELGQLLAAEEKNGEACQDDEVPRLK